jgi:aminomethyltransferase
VLAGFGGPLPEELWSHEAWGEGTIQRVPAGFRLFGDVPALTGVPEANEEEALTVRIEQGRARFGEEISERYLVQETGLLHAVHLSKGCYLGQEIVERVRSRGQVHKQLRLVELDTPEVPAPGAKLTSGGAEAGEVVSAAFSPALDKTVAMAYLRTPVADPGTAVELDGASGRVRALPQA